MLSFIFLLEVWFLFFRNCCLIIVVIVIKIFFLYLNEKRNLSLFFIYDIVCIKNIYSLRLYEYVIYLKLKNFCFVYINLKYVFLVLRFFIYIKILRGILILMLLKVIK